MVWFDPDMPWFALPNRKGGYSERFSAAAVSFCLACRLHQAAGFVESLQRLSGLDWPVPYQTTLCRRQKHLSLQIHIGIDAETLGAGKASIQDSLRVTKPCIPANVLAEETGRWVGYYQRSRVEAKMRCLKLLGERIMAKDFDGQDAEV